MARWLCLGGQRTRQAEEVVQPPPASAADAAAQVKPAVMFHFTASGAVLPLPLTMSVNSVCNRRPFAPEPSSGFAPAVCSSRRLLQPGLMFNMLEVRHLRSTAVPTASTPCRDRISSVTCTSAFRVRRACNATAAWRGETACRVRSAARFSQRCRVRWRTSQRWELVTKGTSPTTSLPSRA